MENSLVLAAKSALPTLSGEITYSQAARMFLSPGYVSCAGNMYQEGLRLSRYIAVDYSIGHGYAHSFLNGIRLYTWDGNRPKLVAQRSFDCHFWNQADVTEQTVKIVKEHLRSSCALLGLGNPSDAELRRLSESLVGETEKATCLIGSGK